MSAFDIQYYCLSPACETYDGQGKKQDLRLSKSKRSQIFLALFLCFWFCFVWFLVGRLKNSASNLVIPVCG